MVVEQTLVMTSMQFIYRRFTQCSTFTFSLSPKCLLNLLDYLAIRLYAVHWIQSAG